MGKRASVFSILGAAVALPLLVPIASLAGEGDAAEQPARQEGEDRWVPSLAIIGGATIQEQRGAALSLRFEDMQPDPIPVRCTDLEPDEVGDCVVEGDDLGVSSFVGGSLELMTPALPIPTRPRLFVSGEILPSFAPERDLALEGDPSCFKGPEPNAPCATEEKVNEVVVRRNPFGEDAANGVGTSTISRVDTLVFGASLGVAWPFRIGERQFRIKSSAKWIHYKVEAEGLVVDGSCSWAWVDTDPEDPRETPPVDRAENQCTDTIGDPNMGYRRERVLTASGSKRFNGIGPALDLEMDTGRFGPIGSSIFLGGGAYRVLGDRSFSFRDSASYDAVVVDRDPRPDVPPDPPYFNDPPIGTPVFPAETAQAGFRVEVDPWVFRAHVGIRLQWLGFRK